MNLDLPDYILDPLVEYAPLLCLAGSAYMGFEACSTLLLLSSGPALQGAPADAFQVAAAFVSLAAAAGFFLAFIWMRRRRRLGWNAVVVAVAIQLLSQVLGSGLSSLGFLALDLVVTAYLLWQIRDSYGA